MKILVAFLLLTITCLPVFAGPPEPPIPAEIPEAAPPAIPDTRKSETEMQRALDTLRALKEFDKNLREMDLKLAKLDEMLEKLQDSIKINDIQIGGDSILIRLNNDSVLVFPGVKRSMGPGGDNSRVNIGSKVVVKEDEVIKGNIINVGADVIVKGTVMGSVWTVGGDIYVTSTGFIQEGALAISGRVKTDPGGRIANLKLALSEARRLPREAPSNPYRIMASVFLIVFIVWLILSATLASLFRKNVVCVADAIGQNPWKSFFFGYLAYLLAFAASVALAISIVGLPLAGIGMPLLVLAAMVLSTTAISNMIGQRVMKAPEFNFRTFFYGNVILSGFAGLWFLIQLITGSLVIMIFSWIIIGIFIFVIIPFGLGAVLMTRLGTRPPKSQLSPEPAVSQVGPVAQ